MNYDFKILQELAWVVAIAVISVVLASLADLDAASVTDWKTWSVGVAFAAVRSAAGAAIAILGRGAFSSGTSSQPTGAPPP